MSLRRQYIILIGGAVAYYLMIYMFYAPEFKQLHVYYTTREKNPLKKTQSLIVIACKILRVIYTILKTGIKYDSEKMLKDIR